MNNIKLLLTAFLAVIISISYGQVRLPKIVADNMVLQRNQVVPIWGWALPGEEVKVKFSGQQKTTKTDAYGFWKVNLSPLSASDKPADMTISASNTIKLSNILVGEVWLCSGQSNMEYKMKDNFAKPLHSVDSTALELSVNYPSIRLFKVEKVLSLPDVTTSGWNECRAEALANSSAIGYFFARNIQRELNVPVGVIMSSWGGSRIEAWTSEEMYASLPAFREATDKKPVMISDYAPGLYYKSMIAPVAPFALKGFLWYQGEANCLINDGMFYADKMQALIEGWRKVWGNNKLPFYSVQIAPFYYSRRNPKLPDTALAEFWEAQYESTRIPNTDLVVTTDLVDNLADIHPPYKWEVARRLSLLALAHNYGKKGLEISGPVYRSINIRKGKAIISFNHAQGLKSVDGKALSWFTISGKDGKFEPANAVIEGNKVVVSSPAVPHPTAVRFGWKETAQPNLFNSARHPAIPFRTDGKKWKYNKPKA